MECRMCKRMSSLLLPLALLLPFTVQAGTGDRLAMAAVLPETAPALAHVRGTVVDDVTGAPVAAAQVVLDGTRFRATTAADGRFLFEAVPAGEYTLRVVHLAYLALPLTIRVGRESLDLAVRLGPSVMPLAPVVVTAFSMRLEGVGFYDRQKRGVGQFMAQSEIAAAQPMHSSDLLRRIPGVRYAPQHGGMVMSGRGRCHFSFIVDGARMLQDFQMDMVAPQFIEGIEFYRSHAELPAPFRSTVGRESSSSNCGIVVLWTRVRS
jgi:hypothetical protein